MRFQQRLLLTLFTIAGIAALVSTPPNAQPQSPSITATPIPPSSPPAYDVMTIKLNPSGSGSSGSKSTAGRYSAKNVSLRRLLAQAYDIRQDLIFGIPGPIDSARFDIEAKVVDPDPEAISKMTQEERRRMLLPLLAQRFQLKTHTEIKTLPIFELVIVKGGPKFKPSADQLHTDGESVSTNDSDSGIKLSAERISMETLAKSLSRQVDSTVVDKTGLTARFDLEMRWSGSDTPSSSDAVLPGIFTAIQEQLGLKLQPAKGPVETLVVDHAEMPTGN